VEAPTLEDVDPARHLLDRAAFGPWPGDVERVRRMGEAAWIEEQLAPDTIPDRPALARTARIDTVGLPARHLFAFRPEVIEEQLVAFALLEAVYSRRQLQQVMVGFFRDHFHVAIGKGRCRELVTVHDRDVVRAHALASFPAMLRASLLSPAMLVYLDGAENRRGAPNENHARELLELHTLGVHGGYTQRDVMEAARCLTGWVVPERGLGAGSAVFDPARHDDGEKTVLGARFASGGGPADVDRLIDLLVGHPSCAHHLASKLCRAFIADDPPERAVAATAETFAASRGDIGKVVRAILLSDAFRASARLKLKRPFRFVVSALRLTAADTTARGGLPRALLGMGHAPFQHPTPDGYPERGDAWLGSLLGRFNLALALCSGRLEGASVDLTRLSQALASEHGDAVLALHAHLIGRAPTAAEHAPIVTFLDTPEGRAHPERALALVLSSPGFQWT
jgi:uncharacterized protein (DUF1800 family)